jgi:F0F1-type ATP synthase assembly protein I
MSSDENNRDESVDLNEPTRQTSPASRTASTNPENTTGNISWRQALTTVGIALSIPWMIGVPALIGWWIDKKYSTSPLWLIVGLIAGLLSTAINIAQLLRRFGQFK